jgi:hypothetical protein
MLGGADRRWVLGAWCAAMLLCACGDDDDAPKDSGPGTDGRDAGRTGLPDGTAGKACTSDAQCGGGMCATQIAGIDLTGTLTAAPGGYCTATCMVDPDCGEGGACILTLSGAAAVTGECFATCTENADCRDGYVCGGGVTFPGLTVPNTCRPPPETDQLDDGVAGDMCSETADCPGGMCLTSRTGLGGSTELPGGYCSGRCVEDAHCGADGVCLAALLGGAGSCYQACASDDDCARDGYRCRVLRGDLRGCNPAADPLPANTSGKACTADADCGGAAGTCLTELPASGFAGILGQTMPAPGGYCSQACAEQSDCGAGGVCAGGVLGGGYCFKPCASDSDCREGYLCEDRSIGGPGGAGAADGGAATDGGTGAPTTVCAPADVPDEADAGQ